jgi:hypothetical protein
MSVRLKILLTGKDSVYLSNVTRVYHGLEGLELFRNPPEKGPNLVLIKTALDTYHGTYESSRNYDRGEIARRKMARKVLTELLKKTRDYLQSIATEEDIPELIRAGFEVGQHLGRKKSTTVPAT